MGSNRVTAIALLPLLYIKNSLSLYIIKGLSFPSYNDPLMFFFNKVKKFPNVCKEAEKCVIVGSVFEEESNNKNGKSKPTTIQISDFRIFRLGNQRAAALVVRPRCCGRAKPIFGVHMHPFYAGLVIVVVNQDFKDLQDLQELPVCRAASFLIAAPRLTLSRVTRFSASGLQWPMASELASRYGGGFLEDFAALQ